MQIPQPQPQAAAASPLATQPQQPQASMAQQPQAGMTQQTIDAIPAELERRRALANKMLSSPNVELPEKLDMISKQLKTLPNEDPDAAVNPLVAMQQQQASQGGQPSQPVGSKIASLVAIRFEHNMSKKAAARSKIASLVVNQFQQRKTAASRATRLLALGNRALSRGAARGATRARLPTAGMTRGGRAVQPQQAIPGEVGPRFIPQPVPNRLGVNTKGPASAGVSPAAQPARQPALPGAAQQSQPVQAKALPPLYNTAGSRKVPPRLNPAAAGHTAPVSPAAAASRPPVGGGPMRSPGGNRTQPSSAGTVPPVNPSTAAGTAATPIARAGGLAQTAASTVGGGLVGGAVMTAAPGVYETLSGIPSWFSGGGGSGSGSVSDFAKAPRAQKIQMLKALMADESQFQQATGGTYDTQGLDISGANMSLIEDLDDQERTALLGTATKWLNENRNVPEAAAEELTQKGEEMGPRLPPSVQELAEDRQRATSQLEAIKKQLEAAGMYENAQAQPIFNFNASPSSKFPTTRPVSRITL